MNPKIILFIAGWKWKGSFIKTSCEKTFSELKNHLNNSLNCDYYFFEYPTGISPTPVPIQRDFPPQEGKTDLIENSRLLLNTLRDLFFTYILFEYKQVQYREHRLFDKRIKSNNIQDIENFTTVVKVIGSKLTLFKISLIGHSAGGLVIRQAFVESQQGNTYDKLIMNNYVVHNTLIASPSQGINLKKSLFLGEVLEIIIKTGGEYFLSTQSRQLLIDSQFINNLNNAWAKLPPQYPVRCIYADKDFLITPPHPPNTCIIDSNCIIIPGCGHNSILGPKRAMQVSNYITGFLKGVNF